MKRSYNDAVRLSIGRDFRNANFKKREVPQSHIRRVAELNCLSTYARYKSLVVGKLVRVLESGTYGGTWIEFVYDADRQALNQAAGWSDDKRKYLLDGVKFKAVK